MVKIINGLEERINTLFLSTPYPGDQKFGGQPTGLLYALTVLADRKEKEYGTKKEVCERIQVWCPEGTTDFDNSTLKEELIRYVSGKKPKVVGISTFSASYNNAVSIKKLVKQMSPDTIIVFGGAHEDNYVKHYRKKGSIDADFVVAGDGPYLLDELVKIVEENPWKSVVEIKKEIAENSKRLESLEGAGVLLFNTGQGLKEIFTQAYVEDSTARFPLALDQLPVMPRYLLKDEEEISQGFGVFGDKKTAQVMAGQGCPFGCGFCSEGIKRNWFDADSPRSVNPARKISHLEEELDGLEKTGYKAVFFDDSTFFAKPRSYIAEITGLLKKYDFDWGCQTTQNSIHAAKDLLGELKRSGLKYIYIGIEHYDGQIRDSFGKSIGGGDKFNGHSVEDTISLLASYGISVGLSLTFGHPDPLSGEEITRENKVTAKYAIDRTHKLIKTYENIEGVSLNLVTYHPGTPISERYEEKVGVINYTGHPNNYKPFTMFEEGIGPHPKGMTLDLAKYILTYARQKLRDKLWI